VTLQTGNEKKGGKKKEGGDVLLIHNLKKKRKKEGPFVKEEKKQVSYPTSAKRGGEGKLPFHSLQTIRKGGKEGSRKEGGKVSRSQIFPPKVRERERGSVHPLEGEREG